MHNRVFWRWTAPDFQASDLATLMARNSAKQDNVDRDDLACFTLGPMVDYSNPRAMNLPAGLTTCKQCGRVEERGRTGSYCQTCTVNSIERIFVHAPDQPLAKSLRNVSRHDRADGHRDGQPVSHRNTALTKLAIHGATAVQSDCPRSKAPRYVSINLRPVQQMQMLSDFLGVNFPSTKARAGLANRGSYLAILPDLDVESTPMLNAAINALCWAHIGAKTGDQRLVQRSQASYGQVLSMLITTVHKNSRLSLVEPRAVITSMMLLCLYDGSIPMPSDGENGWRAHYWACQNLLGAYGPSCIRLHDPFDKMLFNSLRMPCFFLGVAKRKAIAFGRPEWLHLAQDINPVTDTFTSYYSAAMRIPSILERVDRILAVPLVPTALKGLCQDIYDLRQDVTQWFTSLVNSSKDPSWEIPELVDMTESTPMLNNEEHLYMQRSKVFNKFLRFGLPMKIVQNHTLAALAYIVLDCSLLRLLHFKAMTAVCVRPETIKDVEKRAFIQAVSLCQSLYHYTSFDGLAYVDFSEFLNDVALNFFEEIGATKETDWCRGLRAAMTLRRSRIEHDIQRRTLCRMGDAGPGFAIACRYKTWDLQS